ncbi:MAG TPA: LPXTG cell wall anchor domain-containing protein [Umezawaea sp.]|nr:LPXTG cell wall anchor domain-containing protein [Umezawaea sp.]
MSAVLAIVVIGTTTGFAESSSEQPVSSVSERGGDDCDSHSSWNTGCEDWDWHPTPPAHTPPPACPPGQSADRGAPECHPTCPPYGEVGRGEPECPPTTTTTPVTTTTWTTTTTPVTTTTCPDTTTTTPDTTTTTPVTTTTTPVTSTTSSSTTSSTTTTTTPATWTSTTVRGGHGRGDSTDQLAHTGTSSGWLALTGLLLLLGGSTLIMMVRGRRRA